jgi:hypothetical protein
VGKLTQSDPRDKESDINIGKWKGKPKYAGDIHRFNQGSGKSKGRT